MMTSPITAPNTESGMVLITRSARRTVRNWNSKMKKITPMLVSSDLRKGM